MTVEVDDPVVVFVYGILAYPSLRPGAATATTLVAGQRGPWLLPDDDQTAMARELVARFRGPAAATVPTVLDPMATPAIAVQLLAALADAARLLGEFWQDRRGLIPSSLEHQVHTVEEQIRAFAKILADHVDTETARVGLVAGSGVVPSVEEATRWRSDQWIVFLRSHGIAQKVALAALRSAAEEADRVPPALLRDVEGRTDLTGMLLDYVAAKIDAEAAAAQSGVHRG